MDTQKTNGTVKSVRKDRKGFQLDNGEWYSSFNGVSVNRGDLVTVEYVVNGNYKNVKNIKVESSMPQFQAQAREDKSKSMELSYSKDIFIALLQKSTDTSLIADPLALATLSAQCIKQMQKVMEDDNKQ